MYTSLKNALVGTLAGLLIAVLAAQLALVPRDAAAQLHHQPGRVATLRVDGMHSEACPVLVRRAAMQVEGVRQVEASLATRSATIEFDERRTSLAHIQRAIKRQVGFDTVPQD